jgi:type I restriction enzyme S subunit
MELTNTRKYTKSRIAPRDWETFSFSDLLDFKNGVNADKSAYGKGIRFVSVLEVINNTHLESSDINGRITLNDGMVDAFRVRRGDILFNRTSETPDEVGLSAVYVDDVPVVFGGFVIRGRQKTSRLDNTFAGYAFRSTDVRRQVIALGQGAIHSNISQSDIRHVEIALPRIEEQRLIGNVISDADILSAKISGLITKKREIKKGAMQELLTGKRRLPGFSGKWKIKKLGEITSSCSSGATPYRGRPEYYKGDIKWITSGELNYNLITDTIEHISEEAVQRTNLKIHPTGTFLMAITGLEAAGTRGACGIVGSPATTNQSCMAIYPTDELKTEYLYQYYMLFGNSLALQYCQGTKQQSYTGRLVRLLPVQLPPTVDEQAAIASILIDMDIEIATMEAKLAKIRNLKRGIIQELLTGKTRLI